MRYIRTQKYYFENSKEKTNKELKKKRLKSRRNNELRL